MATRRAFLISSFAAAAVPGVAGALDSSMTRDARVFAEILCRDTQAFARACGCHTASDAHDPSAALFALEAELGDPGLRSIVGLSRASSQFLVEQIALRHRFELVYRGTHHYGAAGLRHTLTGPRPFTAPLLAALQVEPQRWPRALATAFAQRRGKGSECQRVTAHTAVVPPPASSLQLASWILARR
jgi:hypothetical protein